LTTAYPGIHYQTPTFYAGPYTSVSPNLLGYSAGQPQVNLAGQPQVNTSSERNANEIANSSLPTVVKNGDSRRRCWVCQSEQHFFSNCPNKIPRAIDASLAANNDIRPELNDPNEPCRYCKKAGYTVKDCFKLPNKNAGRKSRETQT